MIARGAGCVDALRDSARRCEPKRHFLDNRTSADRADVDREQISYPPRRPVTVVRHAGSLDQLDVDGSGTLLPGLSLVGDLRALRERAIAPAHDRRVMHNRSFDSSSGVINPKPFSSLNHFTVPVAIAAPPVVMCCERRECTKQTLRAPAPPAWGTLPNVTGRPYQPTGQPSRRSYPNDHGPRRAATTWREKVIDTQDNKGLNSEHVRGCRGLH